MSEEPKYLMRFVGFKEDGSGELKRAAPGGYKQHELQELPFAYSLEPYWEIVDDIPDLEIPQEEPEDSVYKKDPSEIETVKVETKPYEPLVSEVAPEELDDKEVLKEDLQGTPPDEEPLGAPEDSVFTDDDEEELPLKLIQPIEVDMETVDVIHYDDMTVKSLKLFIEQRGGEVKSKWLKPDLVREARKIEESSRAASESS